MGLLEVSIRVVIPAAVAGVVLAIARVKSAAVHHSVWSVVTSAMLATALLKVLLSPVELRVLPAESVRARASVTESVIAVAPPVPIPAESRSEPFPWGKAVGIVYGAGALVSLIRLGAGYRYARRLARGAQRIEADLYESNAVAVPVTIGWLHPKILLPVQWRGWDETGLQAVLAHERAHVRRGDWAVAAMAAINRSVFWFHPLAWWLERKLSGLAEQACDDEAILETGRPADYAQTLLELAAALKSGRTRVAWEMLAMAKAAEVSVRIDRILDEARTISAEVSRRWKVGLVSVALPLIYATAVLHVKPAVAQPQEQPRAQEQTQAPAPAPAPQPAQQNPKPAPAPKAPPQPLQAAPAAPVEPLRLIHRVEPEYPKIARQTGAHGIVQMEATVAPEGHVTAVRVISGHPMLQNAAKDAVMQWLYSEQPAETHTIVTLDFVAPVPSFAGGGNIRQATLISRKEPLYPDEAKRAGVKGTVVLNATIAKDGRVTRVRIVSGHPILAKAAEDAVMQWVYSPTLLNGTAVETETQITLNFVGDTSTQTSVPGLEKAELIERKEPVHPAGELAGLSGTVMFRAKIGLDGRLADIRVTDGPAELVPAALAAVKQWIYRPAKLNEQPVESYTDITLRFVSGR
jgi:TonB family protein